MITKEAKLAVSLSTAVTEVSVTLGTGHVITAFRPLDMDLAPRTFLGIPLSMFNFTGPVAQQLVSLLVVSTVQAFMPRRVTFKTPYKLAHFTQDLVLVFSFARALNIACLLDGGEVLALWTGLGAGAHPAQLQEVLVFNHLLIRQVSHHHALLQVRTALWDGTLHIRLPKLHL